MTNNKQKDVTLMQMTVWHHREYHRHGKRLLWKIPAQRLINTHFALSKKTVYDQRHGSMLNTCPKTYIQKRYKLRMNAQRFGIPLFWPHCRHLPLSLSNRNEWSVSVHYTQRITACQCDFVTIGTFKFIKTFQVFLFIYSTKLNTDVDLSTEWD